MREFKTQRRIEFADTDMGGIVHFSRFFVFMETAEHQFLNALGTSVALEIEDRSIGWPRVAASCEYKKPARFGDVIEIDVRIVRQGRTSMTYGVRFHVGDTEIAEGQMTSVCCELERGQEVRPIPIPQCIADKIAEG